MISPSSSGPDGVAHSEYRWCAPAAWQVAQFSDEYEMRGEMKVRCRLPSVGSKTSVFMCTSESLGPWQLSHWMFARRATCGAVDNRLSQLVGVIFVGKLQPAAAATSSKPLLATPSS